MTVRELREALRGVPGSAEVYVVGDWLAVDGDGLVTDLRPVTDALTQERYYIDGVGVEVLLETVEMEVTE